MHLNLRGFGVSDIIHVYKCQFEIVSIFVLLFVEQSVIDQNDLNTNYNNIFFLQSSARGC